MRKLFALALLLAAPLAAQPPESKAVKQLKFEQYMNPPVSCNVSNNGVVYLNDDGHLYFCNSTGWIPTDQGLLATLSCATNEVAKWNGSAWVCAADVGGAFTPDADPGVDHSNYVAGHGDGADCPAGQYARGVDAEGVAQSCTPDSTGTDSADDLSDNMLTDLSDVTGSPSTNEVLKWNGSAWAPATDDTGGGGGFNCLGDYIRVSANAQNINGASTDNLVDWNVTAVGDNGTTFTHSTGANPSRVAVNATARYTVVAHLSFDGSVSRYNGRVKVRVNGTSVEPYRGKSGYIRNASGHNEASLTLPAFTLELTAGDYVEVLIDRETVSGTINLSAGESFLELRCAN